MDSKNLKRLSMLLPTVVGMSLGTMGQSSAYQLGAADYASRIATALASGQLLRAASAVERLRSCGVESLSVGGRETSLAQIDDIIRRLDAGETVSVDNLLNDDARFVIGSTLETEVNCTVMADGFVPDNLSTHPSGGGPSLTSV